MLSLVAFFFFQAEDGIRDADVTGVQTCALPIWSRYEAGPSIPGHWPLDVQGFVTRGQVGPGDPAESHAGIDIAAPQGTPVRAAGGGTVEAAGMDRDYGMFVLLRHSEGD